MKIRVLLVILTVIYTVNAFAQKRRKNPPIGTFVSEAQFKDYIPISPLDFEQDVVIYNVKIQKFDTLSLKQLSTDKQKIIAFLPNETVYSTLEKRHGSYTVTLDYAKFTTLKYTLNNENCAGFTKVGVGMRITAKIATFEAGVDVSSLIGLGIAAKTGKLIGQLSIDIIGMESKQITDLVTLPVDISESSIQTALQSLSAIKSKMYDENTNLHPQILAIKNSNGSCSVFDLLKDIDASTNNTLRTGQQQRQQQQQQQK